LFAAALPTTRDSRINKPSSSSSVISNSSAYRVMTSCRENKSLLIGRSNVALHSRRIRRPFADLAKAASTRRRGPGIGALNRFLKVPGPPWEVGRKITWWLVEYTRPEAQGLSLDGGTRPAGFSPLLGRRWRAHSADDRCEVHSKTSGKRACLAVLLKTARERHLCNDLFQSSVRLYGLWKRSCVSLACW
jgi:hypothetical protein